MHGQPHVRFTLGYVVAKKTGNEVSALETKVEEI